MLLAVYFDDKALFDDLYNYAKLHFNENGLMGWHVDAEGNFTTTDGGSGAATDADEDMAVSLMFAFKKWGNEGDINYEEEAKNLINAIMTYEVDPKTYVLKPGDQGGGPQNQPLIHCTAWYRIFYDYTKDEMMSIVISKCFK
jgi:endo-1,4-beta-D-glucanase Y